ncbi:tail fiber domain-containing protein [bacterium]|nr:tail fiber domain-containing protein [bacterium]
MAAIASYGTATPATGDKVIGTDATDGSAKNFTVDALSTLHWTAPTFTGAVDLGAGGVAIGNADLAVNSTAFTVDGSASKVAIGLATGGGDGTLHVHTATAGAVTADAGGDDLIVENPTDVGISLLSSNTGTARLYFGDTDSSVVGIISYGHTADAMTFITGGTAAMTIDSSQDVGIGLGSTAPDGKLHVFTASAGTVTADAGGDELVLEDTTNVGMSMLCSNTGTGRVVFGDTDSSTVGIISYSHTADVMTFIVNGTAAMSIDSAQNLVPVTTESFDLGSASFEWDNVFTQNAVTVSDQRRKENIIDIESPLAFVNSLRPVKYTLKDTIIPAVPAVLYEEGEEIVRARPAVFDEDGNEIEPAVDQVIATGTEVKTEAVQERIVTHSRPHTGFIAQEVKAAMGENDWAGYAYDGDSDTHMLRLTEFIGYLVGAVKELSAKVEVLENA